MFNLPFFQVGFHRFLVQNVQLLFGHVGEMIVHCLVHHIYFTRTRLVVQNDINMVCCKTDFSLHFSQKIKRFLWHSKKVGKTSRIHLYFLTSLSWTSVFSQKGFYGKKVTWEAFNKPSFSHKSYKSYWGLFSLKKLLVFEVLEE